VELVGAKQIASVVGTMVSMLLALARLMTCSLYAVLNSSDSWYQRLTLTKEAQDEVKFWLGV